MKGVHMAMYIWALLLIVVLVLTYLELFAIAAVVWFVCIISMLLVELRRKERKK
jgi:hypothetical protein